MHRGCFVWTPTPPLAGRRTPRPGPVRVCVCVLFLAGSGGPASRARSGAPHLFLWPLCLSALLGPLRAGVALFSFAAVAVPRWLFFSASRCLARPSFGSLAWPLAALWWLLPRPPPPLCPAGFVAPACGLGVFFFSFFFFLRAPPLSPAFSGFRPLGALGLGACVVCFVGLPLLGSPCACPSFVLSAWLLAAPAQDTRLMIDQWKIGIARPPVDKALVLEYADMLPGKSSKLSRSQCLRLGRKEIPKVPGLPDGRVPQICPKGGLEGQRFIATGGPSVCLLRTSTSGIAVVELTSSRVPSPTTVCQLSKLSEQ